MFSTTSFPRIGSLVAGLAAALVLVLAAPLRAQCVGDCSDDGEVTVDDLLVMVNIALGSAPIGNCTAGDSNMDGEITIDEILMAVNNALLSCPTAETPTPTPTTPAATPTPTPTPTVGGVTPLPTPTVPAGCGDGMVDFAAGETCDTALEPLTCPPNCRIRSCTPDGTTREVEVSFAPPAGEDLVGLTAFLRYEEDRVRIRGRGSDDLVFGSITALAETAFFTPNDLNWALLTVWSTDGSVISPGPLFRVTFESCTGNAPVTAQDFTCTIQDASNPENVTVTGATCSVTLP